MKSVKKYPWIDTLYTIGIMLVIFGHSHPSDWILFSGTIFEKIILFIYTFHMPLFFFISGFLFMNSQSLRKLGYKKWIQNKMIRLLTPYVFLSVIAIVPKYYLEYHSFVTSEYLAKAIFVPRVGVWGHFWFIPVLLWCYMLFGICRSCLFQNESYMVCSLTLISLIVYFLPISTQWLGISDLRKALFYFCIGMGVNHFRLYEKSVKKCTRLIEFAVASIISIILVNCFYGNQTLMFCVAMLMIFACYQIARVIPEQKLSLEVSKHNFTIYIYSWLFQAVIMGICGKIGMMWEVTSISMFFSGFLGPMFIVWIYRKYLRVHNRFFELLLGIK